jgi:membrane protease YdiL (CAAX protease family)
MALGIVAAVVLILPALFLTAGTSPTSGRGVVAELYTGAAVAVALWLLGHFIERRSPGEVGLRPAGIWQVALGFAIGAAVAGAAVGFLALTGSYSVTGWGDLHNSLANLLLLLGFELGSAALQAILFYGIVFRILLEWLGSWPAIALSVVLFGLLNLTAAHATLFGAIVVGLSGGALLAVSYIATRAVCLPLGILWGLNFLFAEVLGAIPSSHHRLLQARLSGNDFLTGGAAGAESGAGTLVAASVAVAAVLFWVRSSVWRRNQALWPPS